jgi:hypothetical protein
MIKFYTSKDHLSIRWVILKLPSYYPFGIFNKFIIFTSYSITIMSDNFHKI